MALARYPLVIAAGSTAAVALLIWFAALFSPAWQQNEQPAQPVVAAQIDARRIDEQLASMRDMRRRFQSADTRSKRMDLKAEYQRVVGDGVALLTLFRESVPKLDGQSLAPPVVLSDEPDVVEHIVDLMELTIRMQAEQLTVMMESWVRPD